MLETFRKHHYILMCFVAVVVIIAFTFLYNPSSSQGDAGSTSQRVGTLYGKDFTLGEVQSIGQLQAVLRQLAAGARDSDGDDPIIRFAEAMSTMVNDVSPTNRDEMDLDYPINVLVLRKECEKLGIDMEREDIEKFIKEIGAFRRNGAFDAAALEEFLNSGRHGDRAATETKLLTALRDVMLFQRLAQLVGGTYAPSQAEIDADYARQNQKSTVATVLLEKKNYENQTVTDEEIQTYYDEEKVRHEAAKAGDTPAAAADPIVLSEEKRTVKYVVTEAPSPPKPPQPPKAPTPPLKEDISKLPEDQKKAKEEEYKKLDEEFKAKQDEYNKATASHAKEMEEHQKKVAEAAEAKQAWLKNVEALCNAIVAEERGQKTFEDLLKELGLESPPAAAKAESEPAKDGAVKPETEPEKATATDTAPEPAKESAEATPEAAAKDAAKDAAEEPVKDPAQVTDAKPAKEPAKDTAAEAAKEPDEEPAKAAATKEGTFEVKTATFTAAAAPEEFKKITAREGGDAVKIIFAAPQGGLETWIEAQDQNAFCFFQVTDVQTSSVLPLAEVKQKISDKRKAKKVADALQEAADDARSKILEAIKEGKSFKDAAAAAMLTATELPAFSTKTPLPAGTTNAAVITSTVTGESGMGTKTGPGLQAGQLSDPLEVPEGLLFVYVEKKELPKHPEMNQQKKALVQSRTFEGAAARLVMPQFDQQKGFQVYMAARQAYEAEAQYFRDNYGGLTNPLLKAWFGARRAEAQSVSQ